MQVPVGVGHRGRADPEVAGEAPHRGQSVPGPEIAAPDRILDAAGNLPGGVAGETILYCMIHILYCNKYPGG